VNRSQKDIAEGVPIRQGLAKESAFFKSHPKYRSHPARCGTTNLARTLNQILMHHIRDCLPDIKSRVSSKEYMIKYNNYCIHPYICFEYRDDG
jgi:dynamin 1-like protein